MSTTWSFSQTFTAQFQASRSDLESWIAAANASAPSAAVLQDLTIGVAQLAKSLADATNSLPSYDRKLYESQLKSLEASIEALRVAITPKSRFAFKRKAPSPPSASSNFPDLMPSPSARKAEATPSSDLAASTSSNLILKSHSHQYLSHNSLPHQTSSSDLTISDLKNCVVNLLPHTDDEGTKLTLTALHVRDLTNCVLLLPFIGGSALIHDLKNCVIVLGCHQFRMHTSTSIDVFLKISSNPIIEDCQKIRFSMYPIVLAPQLLHEKPIPAFSVQDFSHIRSSPSPNYTLMVDKLGIEVKPWPTALLIEAAEVQHALARILPEEV